MWQLWQSMAGSTGLVGRQYNSLPVPGWMSPPRYLISRKHPGREAELQHSLFEEAIPLPPSLLEAIEPLQVIVARPKRLEKG